MKILKNYIAKKFLSAKLSFASFAKSERGDTNFVSMLLIIGIVVVLAIAFLALANGAMDTIGQKVTDFINSL